MLAGSVSTGVPNQPSQQHQTDATSSAAALHRPEVAQQQDQSRAAAALFEIAATPSVPVSEVDGGEPSVAPSVEGSTTEGHGSAAAEEQSTNAVRSFLALPNKLRIATQKHQGDGSGNEDNCVSAEARSLENSVRSQELRAAGDLPQVDYTVPKSSSARAPRRSTPHSCNCCRSCKSLVICTCSHNGLY